MRCLRTRVRIPSWKKGRKGFIAKNVFKLTKYIYYRLKKLTSKNGNQYGSKTLQIIIKYRHPSTSLPTKGLTSPCKLRTYKRIIPLFHPVDPKFPFVEFWHQLNKKALILQIIEVCQQVPRRIFALAQYISLEAKDFVRCHLHNWVQTSSLEEYPGFYGTDMNLGDIASMTHKSASLSEDHVDSGLVDVYPIFMPSGFMDTYFEYGKIPMKQTIPAKVGKESPIKKKSRTSNLKVHHRRLVGKRDCAKMRQTRIEEFFKPRASIDVGATSRGAPKKQNA